MEDPFGVTPDPRFLYFGREHREALSSLYYGIIESRGFAVMVAAPGMGKTTLLQYLRERMKERADFASLRCSLDDKSELLQAIMSSLGVESRDGSYNQNWGRFRSFLLDRQSKERAVVLICDEAQSLSDQTLENVRLLSNFETAQRKLLQIILAGQPGLVQKLRSRQLEQLGQRINVSCRIRPLEAAESDAYIHHRLTVAGRKRRLFTLQAVSSIAQVSQGIPRNINTLCYNAMALASVLGRRVIDEGLVRSAVKDLPLAEPPPSSASLHLTPRDGAYGALPEPPVLELSRPEAAGMSSLMTAKPPLHSSEDGPVVRNLSAQVTEILRKLDKLAQTLDKLNGMIPGGAMAQARILSVDRDLKRGPATAGLAPEEDGNSAWSEKTPLAVEA